MRNDKPLTYAKLSRELDQLGYSRSTITWDDGKEKWKFEHRDLKNATILLPVYPLDQTVHRWHLGTVRGILQAHGLLDGQLKRI